ncbi:MAG: SIR2 family protein [Acidimicrobiales bacterium]
MARRAQRSPTPDGMNRYYDELPDQLLQLAAERRLIPFVGAGFSAAAGLPSWEGLLRRVAADLDECEIAFDDLLQSCDNDLLRAAEYLYLIVDRQIGPIRHALEKALLAVNSDLLFGPHVELVNLQAPRIYTTNYDDLIEQTYRTLGLDYFQITRPHDLVLADDTRTHIVKYHGDLRHEDTLVLTESSYFSRLDLQSALDLKFRSDLLGRSVLFMGYGLRDVNVRLIWFKLAQMLADVAPDDRLPAFIVRTKSNPVIEQLDRAAGLTTIVIGQPYDFIHPPDRTAEYLGIAERVQQATSNPLGHFLRMLSLCTTGMERTWSTDEPQMSNAGISNLYASTDVVRSACSLVSMLQYPDRNTRAGHLADLPPTNVITELARKRIPERMKQPILTVIEELVRSLDGAVGGWISDWVALVERCQQLGIERTTELIAGILLDNHGRQLLQEANLDWEAAWRGGIGGAAAGAILMKCEEELTKLQFMRFTDRDADTLAACIDLAMRIRDGGLLVAQEDDPLSHHQLLQERADSIICEAHAFSTELGNAIDGYTPPVTTKPEPRELASAVRRPQPGG